MPTPTQPNLTLQYRDTVSFKAIVAGSDLGVTNRLFYSLSPGSGIWTEGNSRVGDGEIVVANLTAGAFYTAYIISDNGGSLSFPTFKTVSLTTTGDELSTAVINRFNSISALSSYIPGGLWLGEVPENSQQPYAWLEISAIDTTLLMKGEFEYGRFLIHVFGPGAEKVQTACRQLKAAFDYQTLSFVTKTCIYVVPVSYLIRCEALRNKEGVLMYRGTLLFRVMTDDVTVNV